MAMTIYRVEFNSTVLNYLPVSLIGNFPDMELAKQAVDNALGMPQTWENYGNIGVFTRINSHLIITITEHLTIAYSIDKDKMQYALQQIAESYAYKKRLDDSIVADEVIQ